ncbi:MAG: DUF4198 domain-containing protein [Psychrobium sp.]
MRTSKLLMLSALIASSTSALAHTPYLQPTSFEVNRSGKVSFDASFAEKFFVPEVAFNNSIFKVTGPDGKQTTPEFLSVLSTRTVAEHTLKTEGTYRVSTGNRLGKIFKIYKKDGERHAAKDPKAPLPKGAKLLSFFQSNTKAETYVTKGKPSQGALAATNEGLELVMNTHPNELFVGDDIDMTVQYDGKGIDDLTVEVMLAKDQFSTDKASYKIKSDDGKLTLNVEEPGTYLLRARHRTDAPEGSVAPVISNTYTLTLEIID